MQGLKARFFVLLFVLFAAAAAAAFIQGEPRLSPGFLDVSRFPAIQGWTGVEVPVERGVKELLETEDVLLREYRDGSGVTVGLALVYYADPERIALHLPESCLLGHGSRLVDRKPAVVHGPGGDFPCMRLVTETPGGKAFVLYYFQTGGYHTGSYLGFRAALLTNRLKGNLAGGALVRFSMPLVPGMTEERCMKLLESFAASAAGTIDRYLP